jgi:predicted nucleic acid-binding protein
VRALTDCLIASVVLRCELSLLHADADFDAIARHAPLRIA